MRNGATLMDNSIIVQANENCLEKLLSYNRGHGQRVKIYIEGEYLCDIFIDPNLVFKALYEASKKGAEIKFYKFQDKARLHYYKELKGVNYLSDMTMDELIKLSNPNGKYLSIKEIQTMYDRIGKEIESNYQVSQKELFNRLSKIVNDYRHAQLEHRMFRNNEKNTNSHQLQNTQ